MLKKLSKKLSKKQKFGLLIVSIFCFSLLIGISQMNTLRGVELPDKLATYSYTPHLYADGLTHTEPSADNDFKYEFQTNEFNRWLGEKEGIIKLEHDLITNVNTTYGASQMRFEDLNQVLDYDNHTISGEAEDGDIENEGTGIYPAEYNFIDNEAKAYEPEYIASETKYAPDYCDPLLEDYDWYTGYHGSGAQYVDTWKKAEDWHINISSYDISNEDLHIAWEIDCGDSITTEAKIMIDGTQYGDVKSHTGGEFATYSVDISDFSTTAEAIEIWLRIVQFPTNAFVDDFHVGIGGGYDSTSAENEAVNDIDFVDECSIPNDGNSYISIENEVNNHNKILNLENNGNKVNVRNTFSETTSGGIDFWIYLDTTAYHKIFLMTTTAWSALISPYPSSNTWRYYDGSSWHPMNVGGCSLNTWYYVNIDFDYSSNSFDLTVNGNTDTDLDTKSYSFTNGLSFETNGKLMVDGIDFSWANGYSEREDIGELQALKEEEYYGGRILEDEIQEYSTCYADNSTEYAYAKLNDNNNIEFKATENYNDFKKVCEYYIGGTGIEYITLKLKIDKQSSWDLAPIIFSPFSVDSGDSYAHQSPETYPTNEWFLWNLTFPDGAGCDGFSVYIDKSHVEGDLTAELHSIETPPHTFDDYDIELEYNFLFYYMHSGTEYYYYHSQTIKITKRNVLIGGTGYYPESAEGINSLEIHFQMRSTPENGQLLTLTELIFNDNRSRAERERYWNTGITWGLHRIQFGNLTYSHVGDSPNYNTLAGVRNFYFESNSKIFTFFDLPLYEEKIGITIPQKPAEQRDYGDYWTYISYTLAEDYTENIELEESVDLAGASVPLDLSYDFTHIKGAEYTAKFYYTSEMIDNADFGDWRFWIINMNIVRNGIVMIFNALLLVVQFLLYLVVYALNFIIGFIFITLLFPFLWNIPMYYLLYALVYVLFWILIGLVILLDILLAMLNILWENVLVPLFDYLLDLLEELLPYLVVVLIEVIVHILSALIWICTLGQADYSIIYNNVSYFVDLITDYTIQSITFFVYYIPDFLVYSITYVFLIGLLYLKYMYAKARGFVNRAEQIYSSIQTYMIPINLVKSVLVKLKEILFGWI